jgi:hypothetical protein
MKYVVIIIGMLFLFSCENEHQFSLFPLPSDLSRRIEFATLDVDTIVLDERDVESSQMGFSGINQYKDYYFVDSRFCWYYVFDLDGNFKHRYLGQGAGPQETVVGRIATCCLLPDTSLFFMGLQLDHYIYDKYFNKRKYFSLYPEYGKGKEKSAADIPENWTTYTHNYGNLKCRNIGNNRIYMDIYSEHPDFNYIEHAEEYLVKSCHILEIDIANESVSNLLATGYPPMYYEKPHNYVMFSGVNFDIDNQGNFYVNYEADSLIYQYDKTYKPLCSFGYQGFNMNMKYKQVVSFNEIKQIRNEKTEKGYYSWVEFVDETGLLFRSYKKGIHEITDGLQIYSGKTLIADIAVPKGLKVAGYVAPYYYSQAVADEEKETLNVYRFTLDKQ